ncbi:MAG: septum site-determining protein MinC [Saccharospirillum sp.]
MNAPSPLSVKARMLPVQRLIIEDTDLQQINGRLQATLAQAPALFRQAPVALDIGLLATRLDEAWLGDLLALAREQHLVVFALAGPKAELAPWCEQFNLAWLDDKDRGQPNKSQKQPRLDTQVVTQPVRSGQQIYARGANLLVMSQVSAGAEIIADGSIHVFGALRGRAMAGVQGLDTAEIVCQQMDADLVAIAGTYRVRDDMPEQSARAARVYLNDDQLVIDHYS